MQKSLGEISTTASCAGCPGHQVGCDCCAHMGGCSNACFHQLHCQMLLSEMIGPGCCCCLSFYLNMQLHECCVASCCSTYIILKA